MVTAGCELTGSVQKQFVLLQPLKFEKRDEQLCKLNIVAQHLGFKVVVKKK